jgi:hypothetical protein
LSIKDNVKAVKEELGAEEKFLESVIKAEGFFKKYKKPLIALLVGIVLFAVISAVTGYIKESNLRASNEAYATLLKNPNDTKSLELLKSKNPALYEAYIFSGGIKTQEVAKLKELKSKVSEKNLKDLIDYQTASLSREGLEAYRSRGDAILRELALFEEAYLLLKAGKIKEAKSRLSQISPDSPLKYMVQNLQHYIGE